MELQTSFQNQVKSADMEEDAKLTVASTMRLALKSPSGSALEIVEQALH